MFFSRPLVVAAGLLLPAVLARTDLQGCTSSATVAYGGASLIWYVPDTGEICSFLDCGGGRAPPITTRPGCNGYTGTATVTPSFLPGFGAAAETGATAGGGVSATMSTEPLPSATEAVSSSLSLSLSSSTEPSSFSTTLADSLTTAPATLPVSATSSATVSTKEETSAATKDHTASTNVSTLPGKTVISSSTKTTGSSSGTATSKSTQASAAVTGAADTIRAMGVSGMVGMVAVAGAAGLALL